MDLDRLLRWGDAAKADSKEGIVLRLCRKKAYIPVVRIRPGGWKCRREGEEKEHAWVREPSRAPLQKHCFQRMNRNGGERLISDLDLRRRRHCRWVRSVWADPYQ